MSLTRAFSRAKTGGQSSNNHTAYPQQSSRDSNTPPTSPRKPSKRTSGAMDKRIGKFQISAPVELISTTNMISYTSPSLRSSVQGQPELMGESKTFPMMNGGGSKSGHKQKNSSVSSSSTKHLQHKASESIISVKTDQTQAPARPGRYYPPSPASSGGSLPPMSPETSFYLEEVLTPPTTPPPNHLTEYFPKRSRSSTRSNTSAPNTARSSSSSANLRESMERQRQISRIKSVSSINSSSSSSSGGDRLRRESDQKMELPSPLVRANTFGIPQPAPTSAPAQTLRTHKSTISTSSVSSNSFPTAPSTSQTAPIAPPARSSARISRSASNPVLRTPSGSRTKSKSSNPFAQELAQVSELAEDLGLDLDEEHMVRKGLHKFSAVDYLTAIRDVMLYPPPASAAEEADSVPELAPVVPLRKKPSVLRRVEEKEERERERVYAPQPVAVGGQVDMGGWI